MNEAISFSKGSCTIYINGMESQGPKTKWVRMPMHNSYTKYKAVADDESVIIDNVVLNTRYFEKHQTKFLIYEGIICELSIVVKVNVEPQCAFLVWVKFKRVLGRSI